MNYGPLIVRWELYKAIEEAIDTGATSDMEVWMYIQHMGVNYPEPKVRYEGKCAEGEAGEII